MRSCLIVLLFVLCLAASVQSAVIMVDGSAPSQLWEGWGTSDLSSFDALALEPEAGSPGGIPVLGRKAILKLYYRDLGMNFIRISPWGYEPVNDNDDPFAINPAGFVWEGRGNRPVNSLNNVCRDHLVMGKEFRDKTEPFVFYPAINQWEAWMSVDPKSHWMLSPGSKLKAGMVDEYAEHAVAGIMHVKERFGYSMPYWSLFNEPSNAARPSKETTLALVLACGRSFKQHGVDTKLVICDDVTPESSAAAIEYVLADEEARGYVGAVSYHRYCGDFVLEQVKPMLRRIDKGELLVERPVSFYDSARKYGKSVWLSEQCSYGDQGITLYDTGRARASHICDEINNAGVNSFNFMLCWFTERGRPGNEECPIYLRFKDGRYSGCEVNVFGAWLRHFTRYIRPGMSRLPISSDDNMVKAVAFQNRAKKGGSLVIVAVCNSANPTKLSVRIKGAGGLGLAFVHRTDPQRINQAEPAFVLKDGEFNDTLPGHSVTTYSLAAKPGAAR